MMRHTTSLLAGAAVLFLLAGCENGPASGSGATVVDDDVQADSVDKADNGDAEPADDAALGTRDNPLPLGTEIEMGDWTLAVTEVTLDATDAVMSANEFNDRPAAGRQFVMFAVDATYEGDESGTAWVDFSWAIVGSQGNTFGSAMDDYCGVIPQPLDDAGETFPGGSVSGNVCVSAASDQLDGGTIRIEAAFSFEDTRAFYALP